MTDIIMIPLSKLVESEDNVRRSKCKGGVAELAASIRSLGLLQSIVVRATDTGKFAVIAGGRRLRALRMLAKAGDIEKSAPIPCRVASGDDNPAELSLAENITRQDLLAWEELDAFKRLIDNGEGPEAIAERFGVSPSHVARRLKLARVSPRLIEALKRDEATLDQLAALAFTDDHAAQEKAFFEAPDWARAPERLRAQVTQAHIPETDKLARFVGVDAYQAEGGAVVSDLFAEANDDSTRYLADRDLLIRLAVQKLEPIVAEVRGEGWAWVEIGLDGVAWAQFPERVREHRRALSEAKRIAQERLFAKLDETEDETEIAEIEAAIDALASSDWNPEEVALAGSIICLSHDGKPKIERGLVKVCDVKAFKTLRRKLAKPTNGGDQNDEAPAAATPRPSLPAKLIDELMAHKTLALRAELASKPDLALRLVAFTLAASFVGCPSVSCLDLALEEHDVARSINHSEAKSVTRCAEHASAWRDQLSADPEALWAFVLGADQQTLLDLMAVVLAAGIDLRVGAHAPNADARKRLGALLTEAAGLDMSAWWTATPESFFAHVRKHVIIEALLEVAPALDRAKLEKAPKSELLSRAKRSFKKSAWLPAPLRPHSAAQTEPQAIAAE